MSSQSLSDILGRGEVLGVDVVAITVLFTIVVLEYSSLVILVIGVALAVGDNIRVAVSHSLIWLLCIGAPLILNYSA